MLRETGALPAATAPEVLRPTSLPVARERESLYCGGSCAGACSGCQLTNKHNMMTYYTSVFTLLRRATPTSPLHVAQHKQGQ